MAAIPGWTATWDPQDGPSVTLAVAADGLVQAVDVPPGLGTLVFSYNPPGFTAGFAASLAALVILTGLLLRPPCREPRHGVRLRPGYLAGWAMVSMTAVMARNSTSSWPGATSTP